MHSSQNRIDHAVIGIPQQAPHETDHDRRGHHRRQQGSARQTAEVQPFLEHECEAHTQANLSHQGRDREDRGTPQ